MLTFSWGILQFCCHRYEIVFRSVYAAVFYCKIPVPTHDRFHFLHDVELCNACEQRLCCLHKAGSLARCLFWPSMCENKPRCSQCAPLTDSDFLSAFFSPFPVFKKAFLKLPLPAFALPDFVVSPDNEEFLINFSSGILHVVSKLLKIKGRRQQGKTSHSPILFKAVEQDLHGFYLHSS